MEKQEKPEIKRKHTLSISDKITLTGIDNVITLSEKEVNIKTGNRFLTLIGVGFTPIHIDIDEGTVILTGEVLSFKYSASAEKESFLKKIFK